ncbi:unnamed protein product [Phaedon cochleariae]|uniref:CUB domain-containing protein n=1 Tax=Phaedon cochleariae TaxID=80249 RepID=A0A9N9X062_PHACE|nr:unnamed protein product [Phaedon cochleariae]
MGSCYRRRQCSEFDGIGSTSCASGIGVCCIINRSCGETSSYNNTYFVSPGFPNVYSSRTICTHTIQKINSDVCQVRIDFLTLRLAQPDSNGTCNTDALFISGGASTVPILCGDNTGQHVYVDFNGNANIVITVSVGGAASTAWNIRAAQINCNCPQRAPSGCLQFFNATSGTVTSFNYGSAAAQNGTRQMANLNYGICIATINRYCGIQWSGSGTFKFAVSNNTYNSIADGTIGTIAAENFGSACTSDFIVIPGPILSSNSTKLTSDRFCGNGFATVLSVYKIKCSDCSAEYVGQTGRSFFTRIAEHKNTIDKYSNFDIINTTSSFANHILENKHKHNILQDFEVLHVHPKGKKLNLLELLEINRSAHSNSTVYCIEVIELCHAFNNFSESYRLWTLSTNNEINLVSFLLFDRMITERNVKCPIFLGYTKPFVLTVVTDSNEVNDTGNLGFSLDFSQLRCSGSILLG